VPAAELLAHQTGEEQHRAARPVVNHGLPGQAAIVAGNGDDNADRLAADLRGVVLEEAVVSAWAGVVEVLVFIAAPSRATSSASLSSHTR
jgi:hypothetical protein